MNMVCVKSRGLAVAAVAWAFSPLVHPAADARPACLGGINVQPSVAQLEEFLNTSESMPKTFLDERQFERAGGTRWSFNPPITVSFKQAWMAAPRSVTLEAMKVSQRSNMLTVLLLRVDGVVVPLEGGKLGPLDCP
jgi:hypothetical protein